MKSFRQDKRVSRNHKNYGGCVNQRNDEFKEFVPFGDKKAQSTNQVFSTYSLGVATGKDAWAYNFSESVLRANMGHMIEFYNSEVDRYKAAGAPNNIDGFVDPDSKKISWTRGLKNELRKGRKFKYEISSERVAMYRPFCKQHMYFSRQLNEMVYQIPKLFPETGSENLVIVVSGVGHRKDFSYFLTNMLPDLHIHMDGSQCFPLYYYESFDNVDLPLYGDTAEMGFRRRDTITDRFLETVHAIYNDDKITKEDIFYHCYGILHSPEYKEKFASDLKKILPRLPFVEDFWGFSKGGRDLAFWHLNYESVEPYPVDDPSESDSSLNLRVERMRFAKGKDNKPDKSTIIYNSKITLSGIPLDAYNYQINGKSAIEWIMERYKVTTDKDSGIVNDPNSYSNNPRYVVDLLKRIVRVSMETNTLVENLPALRPLDRISISVDSEGK
jgi:predicted helicase